MSYNALITNLQNRIETAKKCIAYANTYNEGAEGYNTYGDVNYARKDLELATKLLNEANDWSATNTISRRLKWNAAVPTLAKDAKGNITPSAYEAHANKMGFYFPTLKQYIDAHKADGVIFA